MFGGSISLDWSSQTGAGFLYGSWGTGATVDVGGTIGPPLVPKSTLILMELETSVVKTIKNWYFWN